MKVERCYSMEQLQELLDGSVGAWAAAEYESHLESCVSCRDRLSQLAAEPSLWNEAAVVLSSDELESPSKTMDVGGQTGQFTPASISGRHRGAAMHSALQPPSHPEMLGRLGRFDIDSCIGQGGFGVVYKGHDPELNRAVAIKVLAPHLAASGVARKRFAREAQAAAAINHPNVVPIHAIESEGDHPYLVMTYVPGQSLQAYVQKHGPLAIKAVVRIAQQVAAGLDAAHRQGLVHRDIKPANILLENGLNRAMITDFGLARAADDAAVTQTGWLAGTPHYMSPEQAEGKNVDERSDLFSLGSLIYFMATGREPFRGEQPLAILRKIIQERPMPADQVNNEVPRTLARLIERLLEKNPEHRFQSAEQVNRVLEQYLSHLHQPQVHEQPRLGISKRVRNLVMAWSVSAAAVCLAVSAASFGITQWFAAATNNEPVNYRVLTLEQCQEELGQLSALPLELNELNEILVDVEQWPFFQFDAGSRSSADGFQREYQELSQRMRQLEESLSIPDQSGNQGNREPNPTEGSWFWQFEIPLVNIANERVLILPIRPANAASKCKRLPKTITISRCPSKPAWRQTNLKIQPPFDNRCVVIFQRRIIGWSANV